MPTTPPTIDDLPTVPDRSDRATFAARATAMFDAFKNVFVGQIRALSTNVFDNATEAINAASTATSKRDEAVTAASAAGAAAGTATAKRDEAVDAATVALAAFDAFDDRYLGAKAANPTTDNDGSVLAVGALYWSTTGNEMRVWDGSAWRVAYNPATGQLMTADIGVTVQAYDAATAKRNTAQTFSAVQTFGKAAHETKAALGANDIDLSVGNYFTKTVSGATTLTVSNVPVSGTAAACVLELTNGGSAAITWFAGVKWAGGAAPTLTAAGVDILGFYSHDGGTTWRGLVLAKDSK